MSAPAQNLLKSLDYSILQQCMHCGMCLAVCPTYAETTIERHGPRGRIALMRAIAGGELETTRAFGEEMYYCLGCLACASACPAGVNYERLFETARAEVERARVLDSPQRNFWRWSVVRVLFTRPRLLRLAGRALWLWRVTGLQKLTRLLRLTYLLPKRLRELEPQTPRIGSKFSHQLIKPVEKPPTVTQAASPCSAPPPKVAQAASPCSVPPPKVARAASPCSAPPPEVARAASPCSASPPNVTRAASPCNDSTRELAPQARGLPAHAAAPPRRVALLTGCVQDLAFPEINRATADALLANNCEVHTPPVQPCCGSLHAHNGDLESARALARRLIDLIPPDNFDAIISNAGGCGSHLRHFDNLLRDDPLYAARAAAWSRKLRDISEYLVEINFRHPRPPAAAFASSSSSSSSPSASSAPQIITYHESCHLCHAQKVSAQPRALLRAIPGAELRECDEAAWCCGSAGIYNITQPLTASRLQDRKMANLRRARAQIIATANPGCHLQIQNALRAAGDTRAAVEHPVVLLARAYAAEDGPIRKS